ncbi:hypothetical protein RhiirA1_515182, partial [Rhizophagus irregularis]
MTLQTLAICLEKTFSGGLGGTMLPSDLKVKSTNEGVYINNPDVNLRFDIIPPLIKDLIDKKVILVRSLPFSGKTSVAQILEYILVSIGIHLDRDGRKLLVSPSGGHAGLVRHILTSIENGMKKRIDTNCLTWEEIFKYLNSESFDSSIYSNCRTLPKVSALSNEQIKLCEDIYLKGKIRYVDSNEDSVYLVKSGISIIKNDIDGTYLTFVAPLLKRSFFQQNYGVHNSTDSTPTDLYHFIVKIFTAMCNKLSREILRKTLGFGSNGRILEQTWQKEFYRIGTQVLGKDYFLSCDVGSVFG